MKTALILGSNSDIGKACIKTFEKKGYNCIQASRKNESSSKNWIFFDAIDFNSHQNFYQSLNPKPELVISLFGILGSQEKAYSNFKVASEILNTNLLANISILNIISSDFEQKKCGSIICLSSVAGERGRKSNFIYGASKAGLTAYLSGLRSKLQDSNVHVLTIIPGFMKTKMIENYNTNHFLTATPEQVSNRIYRAYLNKRNVVYILPIWRLIMCVIKNIPEFIFKKMNL